MMAFFFGVVCKSKLLIGSMLAFHDSLGSCKLLFVIFEFQPARNLQLLSLLSVEFSVVTFVCIYVCMYSLIYVLFILHVHCTVYVP